MPRIIAPLAALLALTTAAHAQDADGTALRALGDPVMATQARGGPAIGFTLGAGVSSKPEYFGAGDNEAGAALTGELNYLRLGGYTFGNPDPLFQPQGFGVSGSFRYIGERDGSDELAGLDDVDAALEIGAGLSYATPVYEVFGNVRYGVIGHESFVGEVGADLFARPNDRLTLSLGPRALFGDDGYAETYFGVAADEAAASRYNAFDAGGGLVSTGVEFGASYRLNETWGVDASVTYDVLRNDAADSPITDDDESVSASIGITRRFTLGF
ncbi:MltA-interacting protein precursor [Jannaschia seosinensis]|uniref:MltA-interacting protein n=2 Tax=Jannaschia seosinensis TaxID=313367 RepID=A0A0M7B6X8_9RHOB|nr:MltA-interacting protein precursor [Jannaschia seosinensis]